MNGTKEKTFRNPFWIPTGHLQTIVGAYWPHDRFVAKSDYHAVPVSGQDHVGLWVSCPPTTEGKSPDTVVLLIHGLGGSAESPYIVRMAQQVLRQGWACCRLEMRGVGRVGKKASALYHSGRGEDVRDVLAWIKNQFSGARVFLAGYSLGAAVGLHFLTRHSRESSSLVSKSALVSPPLNLADCTKKLQLGWNRIYDKTFARSLWKVLQQRPLIWRKNQSLLPKKAPKTLWDFDDLVTAPLAGFQSAGDYYARCSSFEMADQVNAPTLILAAEDDPIVPSEAIGAADWGPNVQVDITRGGGHLGFVSSMDWRKQRWVESRLIAYFRGDW